MTDLPSAVPATDQTGGNTSENLPARPWAVAGEEVARQLQVDPASGLSAEEAARRLQQYGANTLREKPGRQWWQIFGGQFADVMIGLLLVAGVVSAAIGEWADAVLIALIVIANAVIGAVQEYRAEQAISALRELAQPIARVRRDGTATDCPATAVVPGDVVELHGGDFVPADGRLLEAVELLADEAPLTGESLPVEKDAAAVKVETALPDRTDMSYAGTSITAGRGLLLVTATGMSTELGNIASLLETADAGTTPLQRRLSRLSRQLAIAVVLICLVIFVSGVLRESSENWNRQLFSHMLLVAVSLAVAAIPEGLPAVITIALALGSQRTARRHAIMRRLPAVETLGSVDVICSDKTGTLTQNRMSIADVIAGDGRPAAERDVLLCGILCNDADLSGEGEAVGTPTEAAFVLAAMDAGIDIREVRERWPRVGEIPFSSDRKRMSTLHRDGNGRQVVIVKGAAEAILARCTTLGLPAELADGEQALEPFTEETLVAWNSRVDELAARGRRVLAVAARSWDGGKLLSEEEAAEQELSLLGIAALVDPARPEAADAISECRAAGIRPIMITGDHQVTARAIAEDLGLYQPGDRLLTGAELAAMDDDQFTAAVGEISVYARVSPEHKLRIVRAHQQRGSVVAMTGDGVNDAPALKQADIGIAMGQTGTDVSKQAADMILSDDNFATIVAAVEEGRVVYDNIRKFVRHLLSTNIGEILVLFLAILLGLPLPLVPAQILWINLVTDGLPALALGFEPAEADLMQRQPRHRDESIFAGGMARDIIVVGVLMGVVCVWLFHSALGGQLQVPPEIAEQDGGTLRYARTLVFFAVVMYQLFYVLGIHTMSRSFFSRGSWQNRRLTLAVVAGTILQLCVMYIPLLQRFFHTVSLQPSHLALSLGIGSLALFAAELQKLWGSRSPGASLNATAETAAES